MKRVLKVIFSLKTCLVLVFLAAIPACSPGNGTKEPGRDQLPEPGVVHEKITVFSNRDLSYALYLPSGLTAGKAYPVILALDPGGSGLIPVKKYKELAEKYGYILIGSNDSRNGQPAADIDRIVGGMLGEIGTVYPASSDRIYIAGFSGGSRVACLSAMSYREIRGVIGCGAAFPGGNQLPRSPFDYFGIVGTADFNMNEMLQFEGWLKQLGMRHFITTFPGPHAWPPAGVMEEAFQWITLNAMKDGTLKRDSAAIALIMAGFNDRIAKSKQENQLIEAAETYREAIAFAEGLISPERFSHELKTLEQFPEYKNQLAIRTKILEKENEQQQLLIAAIFSRDEEWWKKRIAHLHSPPRHGLNPEDTLMNARLRTFLSLMCYSDAGSAIKQQNWGLAKKVISIYQIDDPQNPEPNYLMAVVNVHRSENEAAMEQLKVAVTKGFSDKQRLSQQPEFQSLKSSQAWLDLMKTMK